MNPHDISHVEQAIAEVRAIPIATWARMGDLDLVQRILTTAADLRMAEKLGNAEACHEHAKEIAAMAIEYMARGLA